MKNELVVKDNALINASYSLSLVEQRLILLAIVELRQKTHQNELSHIAFNRPIEITASSYIKTFNVHQNTAYSALKDACKALFARQFSYQSPRKKGVANVTARWVQSIAYVDNSATVEIAFSDDVLPLITHLEKQLTSYELKQVSCLTSAYAVRLYELLISWRSVGKTPVIKIEEFRQKMGVLNTEHPRIDNLKRRVIEPAIAQINEHTDITAEYEQHKAGRSIVAFSFKFKEKDKKEISTRDPDTVDMFTGKTDRELEIKPLTSDKQAFTYAKKILPVFASDEISSGLDDYQLTEKIKKILLNPDSANEKYQRKIFKALAKTDFKH